MSQNEIVTNGQEVNGFEHPIAYYFGYLLPDFPATLTQKGLERVIEISNKINSGIPLVEQSNLNVKIIREWGIADCMPECSGWMHPRNYARLSIGFQRKGRWELFLADIGKSNEEAKKSREEYKKDFEKGYSELTAAGISALEIIGIPDIIYPTGSTYGSAPEKVKEAIKPLLNKFGKKFEFKTSSCYIIVDAKQK